MAALSRAMTELQAWAQGVTFKESAIKEANETLCALTAEEIHRLCFLKREAFAWILHLERLPQNFSAKERRNNAFVANFVSGVHAELMNCSLNPNDPLLDLLRTAVIIYAGRCSSERKWSDEDVRLIWVLFSASDRSLEILINKLLKKFPHEKKDSAN